MLNPATVVLMAMFAFHPLAAPALAAPTYSNLIAVRAAGHEVTYDRRAQPTFGPLARPAPSHQAVMEVIADLCNHLIDDARDDPNFPDLLRSVEEYTASHPHEADDLADAHNTGELTMTQYCLALFPELAQAQGPSGGSSGGGGGNASSSGGEKQVPDSTPSGSEETKSSESSAYTAGTIPAGKFDKNRAKARTGRKVTVKKYGKGGATAKKPSTKP